MSRPLVFTMTSPGAVPASTAPALATTNSFLDSLKKVQSSQTVPTSAGEEDWQSKVAWWELCILCGRQVAELPVQWLCWHLSWQASLGVVCLGTLSP